MEFGIFLNMSKSVLEILANKKIISAKEIRAIEEDAEKQNLHTDDVLYKRGISENDVAKAKNEAFGYPLFQVPDHFEVTGEILKIIPHESMLYYRIIPLGAEEGYLDIGMVHPDDVISQEALKFITTQIETPIRIFIITPSDFDKALISHKTLHGEVGTALGEFQKEYEAL